MRASLCLAALATAVALTASAKAATTVYTDRATFEAAAGTLISVDFVLRDDGTPLDTPGHPGDDSYPDGVTLGGTTFAASDGVLFARAPGVGFPALFYGVGGAGEHLEATFAGPTRAFVGRLATFQGGSPIVVTLSSGETFNLGAGSFRFFGVIADEPFTSIRFAPQPNGSGVTEPVVFTEAAFGLPQLATPPTAPPDAAAFVGSYEDGRGRSVVVSLAPYGLRIDMYLPKQHRVVSRAATWMPGAPSSAGWVRRVTGQVVLLRRAPEGDGLVLQLFDPGVPLARPTAPTREVPLAKVGG